MPKISNLMTRKAAEYGLDVRAELELVGYGRTYADRRYTKTYRFDGGFLASFAALADDAEIIAKGWRADPGARATLYCAPAQREATDR